MSKARNEEETSHPFQAVVLCDGWGEEERWGPLVRRKRTDDEEFEDLDVGGEQRPWVSSSLSRCTAGPGEMGKLDGVGILPSAGN